MCGELLFVETINVPDDDVQAIFDGEVSGVEAMQFRLRHIAQVRLAAFRCKEDVPLSPEDPRTPD